MNDNPLAGHPLFQKKEPTPEVIGADFGEVEVRVAAAEISNKGFEIVGDSRQAPPVRPAPAKKKMKFLYPNTLPDAEVEALKQRMIAKMGQAAFDDVEFERAPAPEVAKWVVESQAEIVRENHARIMERQREQLAKAVSIVRNAGRPVKMGFIEHAINQPIFRNLELKLREEPGIEMKRHKGTIYYTWKA